MLDIGAQMHLQIFIMLQDYWCTSTTESRVWTVHRNSAMRTEGKKNGQIIGYEPIWLVYVPFACSAVSVGITPVAGSIARSKERMHAHMHALVQLRVMSQCAGV